MDRTSRTTLIDGILSLRPASAEQRERTQVLLHQMSDERLAATHDGLAALVQDGQQMLSELTPENRQAFIDLAHSPPRAYDTAKAKLEQIWSGVRARQDAASTDATPPVTPGPIPSAAATMPEGALALIELGHLSQSVPKWQAARVPPEACREIVHAGKQMMSGQWPKWAARTPSGVAPAGTDSTVRRNAAWKRFCELAHHPVVWRDQPTMDLNQTIEALARLENFVQSQQPDIIIAMNQEGEAISQVVVDDLGLAPPILPIHTVDAKYVWVRTDAPRCSVKTICVVGHVAWSGATIQHVIHMVRQRFGQEPKIAVAVLASSYLAAERVKNVDLFLFHQVTAADSINLAIDATGYERDGDVFLFKPFASTGRQVAIPIQELRKKRRAMVALYKAD